MNKPNKPLSYKIGTIAAYILITAITAIGMTGMIALMKFLIEFILS